MHPVIKQLFTPIAYLRIEHSVKRWVDFYLPGAIGLAVWVLLLGIPGSVKVIGEDGLFAVITGLLQILVGFYIVALAAIATFQREGMDDPLEGEHATLLAERKGTPLKLVLTRRQFLCYLFGYLAFVSLALYLIGSAANLLGANIAMWFPEAFSEAMKWTFVLIYLLVFSNVVSTTLLGLHYLTDRIHRV